MNTPVIGEGAIQVRVPLPDDSANFPPSSTAVFYNPEMELNRDITVAAISGFIARTGVEPASISYADVMSASGIRGIRMAKEVGLKCHLNDWNQDAYELMRENIKLNGLEESCTPSNQNANTLMHQEQFDIVDLDPFGSPAPFLDAAARSARRLLCITATDTAPLCGAHLKSGIRKYAAVPLNTEYHREMGARILLGATARELARRDKGMNVLLTHVTRHYVRVYLEIIRGVSRADSTMEKLGFIAHCFHCGFRSWEYGLTPESTPKPRSASLSVCPNCGKSLKFAGPLWLGTIQEQDFCSMVLDELKHRKSGKCKDAVKIIEFCKDEIDIPTYYDQHWLCKQNKISAGPIDELVEVLTSAGFNASRTHFAGTGFKTDADLDNINKLLHQLDVQRKNHR
ncbi:MAG: tRNA (guanine(10)-N(2))-dimethyltransferase [Methanosarcinales archaeon]|nr:tRNA (guanine(10)-N(2))-dimethyltransferase [Methanosarcinales archaeon]